MNRRRFLKLGACAGGLGLVGSYPVFIERNIVLTNTYRIPVPNLPPVFSGFRMVHLTDLHYGFLVSLRFLRSIVARANRINRDVVVCTGDYVHQRKATAEMDSVWPLMAELDAPVGVFSVLGNHDHWADTDFSARVDLMVSGHTHGGQVDIPLMGTPVLPVRNKTYSSGLTSSPRGMSIFISRGIGWAVYPVRFNCFPEIAVLELVPA